MKELYCVVLTTGYSFPEVDMYSTKEDAEERFERWCKHYEIKKSSRKAYDFSDENKNSDRVVVYETDGTCGSKDVVVIHMSRRLF